MAVNPFAPVPPPQTVAQGNVQINYDDDDILMDYDDEPQGPGPTMNGNGAGDRMMEVEATGSTLEDADQLVPNKVYLRGVDSMSTGNVKAFVAEHFTETEIAKVEWIDDSSCNLVYNSPENALSALSALQIVVQELPTFTLRPAKSASTHPDSHLEVRIATQNDRKIKGARDRSRYYLFHPEEDRREKLERQRRDTRRPDRRRHTDSADDDDDDTRDYERRYYDSREHSRRRDGASVEVYADNFYDDAPRRREHSSDRDRSCSPGRERARRKCSPIELFPERRSREPMETYPMPERRREQRELFPERAGPSRGFREEAYEPGRLNNESVELFPTKSAASSSGPRFRSERSAPPDRRVELFPEKVAPRGSRKPAALENRITMPARLLEGRSASADGNGGEREGSGFKIKGRGRDMAGGDDLFAEELRAVKGEGLVIHGGSRRERGQRRNRAADMFG